MTTVYTDGACLGNPGPGGWAYAVAPDGVWRSGPAERTTNQRMEITAALRAVEDVDGPLEIISDSTYVVNCFRQGWWKGWFERGWKNSQKKDVANRDLWEPLIDGVRRRGVRFQWVKGHGGDPLNDVVDRLAVEAARTQRGRTGTGHPSDLGAPDMVGDIDEDGRRIAVFGHRPPELDGWDGGPVTDAVRQTLGEILLAKAEMFGGAVVITGLNLGVEQLATEVGLPYVAVLPFPGQEAKWPAAARRRYADLLARAAEVIEVGKKLPASPAEFGKAFGARDREILKLADEAVVVWDGGTGPVKRQLDEAKRALGEEDVWVVDLSSIREKGQGR